MAAVFDVWNGRKTAILLKVGLDWVAVSQCSVTLRPFAWNKYYASNNILSKLHSSVMSHFMWELQD